jgi:hypothetical protein
LQYGSRAAAIFETSQEYFANGNQHAKIFAMIGDCSALHTPA